MGDVGTAGGFALAALALLVQAADDGENRPPFRLARARGGTGCSGPKAEAADKTEAERSSRPKVARKLAWPNAKRLRRWERDAVGRRIAVCDRLKQAQQKNDLYLNVESASLKTQLPSLTRSAPGSSRSIRRRAAASQRENEEERRLGEQQKEQRGGGPMNGWLCLIVLAAAVAPGCVTGPEVANGRTRSTSASSPVKPEQVTPDNAAEVLHQLQDEVERERNAPPLGRP